MSALCRINELEWLDLVLVDVGEGDQPPFPSVDAPDILDGISVLLKPVDVLKEVMMVLFIADVVVIKASGLLTEGEAGRRDVLGGVIVNRCRTDAFILPGRVVVSQDF